MNAALEAKTSELVKEAEELLVSVSLLFMFGTSTNCTSDTLHMHVRVNVYFYNTINK